MSQPGINLHLTVSKIYPKQDFKGQCQYSKGKGQIKATPTSTYTPTSDTLWFPRARTRDLKVKVTTPMSLPCINLLHLTVSEI